jgi:hypothetical protein
MIFLQIQLPLILSKVSKFTLTLQIPHQTHQASFTASAAYKPHFNHHSTLLILSSRLQIDPTILLKQRKPEQHKITSSSASFRRSLPPFIVQDLLKFHAAANPNR